MENLNLEEFKRLVKDVALRCGMPEPRSSDNKEWWEQPGYRRFKELTILVGMVWALVYIALKFWFKMFPGGPSPKKRHNLPTTQ